MEQKSKSLKRLKSSVVSRHQTLLLHLLSTSCQIVIEPSRKIKGISPNNRRDISSLYVSLSPLTQTHGNISCWKDKMCLLLSWGSAKRYSSEQTELQSASSQLLSNAPDSLFNYRDTARTMRAWPGWFHYWAVWGKKKKNPTKVLKYKS